jgi:hypothetical protein
VRDLMLDLETMGVRPTSAIVSIGAVMFDENGLGEEFYTPVSLQSCVNFGLTTDADTVKWWETQPELVRNAWADEHAPLMDVALKAFNDWCVKNGVQRVWGNGADFDPPIIVNAFRALDAEAPWPWHGHRCYRTVRKMFDDPQTPRTGTLHHALDDAKYQAQNLLAIMSMNRLHLG